MELIIKGKDEIEIASQMENIFDLIRQGRKKGDNWMLIR